MDLIDLEDDTIDAEVLDSLAVNMDDFRVRLHRIPGKRTNDTTCVYSASLVTESIGTFEVCVFSLRQHADAILVYARHFSHIGVFLRYDHMILDVIRSRGDVAISVIG